MNRLLCLLILSMGFTSNAFAQIVTSSSPPPSSPPAPLRGAPASTNPFLGSVPAGALTPGPLMLTLEDAIRRGLEQNLGVLTLEQDVRLAGASRWRSLGGLLPNVAAQGGDTRQTVNLAAFGFQGAVFPGLPTVIGPFNVFDARVAVSQPLVNVSALSDLRRSRYELDAAKLESRNARDLVVEVVTDLYLEAISASRRIETVKSQVSTAESLLKLATDQHDAGAIPGIDVLRAQVQVRVQRQRSIEVQNDFDKAKLQLLRAIGLPSAQPVELAAAGNAVAKPALTLDEALERARTSRPDYQAAIARLHAAEADRRAAEQELLPSVHLNADIGAIGPSVGQARQTYSIAGVVRVPVFDAGRREGRLAETQATLLIRRAEAADFVERVASEVRTAFLDVQSAEQRLQVAREGADLARQELALAQTRFAAGVTGNLEVIQAQNEVATANDNEIASEQAFNAAKAALSRVVSSGS